MAKNQFFYKSDKSPKHDLRAIKSDLLEVESALELEEQFSIARAKFTVPSTQLHVVVLGYETKGAPKELLNLRDTTLISKSERNKTPPIAIWS